MNLTISMPFIYIIQLLLLTLDAKAAPFRLFKFKSKAAGYPNSVTNFQLPHVMAKNYSPPATATTVKPSTTTTPNGSAGIRWRKRHRKRHSISYDYNNYNENSTIFEWSNPCNGFYVPNAKRKRPFLKRSDIKIYNILKISAKHEYKRLTHHRHQDIDISNVDIWWLHNYSYKFLPKLKINSSIALKRWYRNMQTYVASFGYLRRIQLQWDNSKSHGGGSVARELTELLESSRNMLCELERAVNQTQARKSRTPVSPATNMASSAFASTVAGGVKGASDISNMNKNLFNVSREQMNKRLKLRTKLILERNENVIATQGADSVDLIFVKYYYYEYLKNIWKLLREHIKIKSKVNRKRLNLMFNEIDDRPHRRLRKKQLH